MQRISVESKIHHTISYKSSILPTPYQRLFEFVKNSNNEVTECRIDRKCFRFNHWKFRYRDYDEHHEEFCNEHQHLMFLGPIKAKMIINDGNEYDGTYFSKDYHLQLEHNTFVEKSKCLEYLLIECIPREDAIEIPISIQFAFNNFND